ncbi:MAG: zf-HC2 domain-containing protein [Burkholderiales bacterium]|nr:zf-HC2 domain-containing protein [Burkholderiales bacterium]
MYSCEQAARLSSKAMEQPLAPKERILLGMHLMMCKGCTGFAQQIEFLRRASRKIPEVLEKDAD